MILPVILYQSRSLHKLLVSDVSGFLSTDEKFDNGSLRTKYKKSSGLTDVYFSTISQLREDSRTSREGRCLVFEKYRKKLICRRST